MNKRFIRQSFLGENSDEIFSNSIIAIVGLCGGGSHIAQQLAHMGFENLLIFDFDHVEEPNLNRMVGALPQDAIDGALKTDVIERLIKGINPEANVTKITGYWQEASILLRDCNAIIGCVDSYSAREELERHCRRFLIPYIDIGMDVFKASDEYSIVGQVITSLPESICMRCLGYITENKLIEESRKYGDAGEKPQVIWINGVLASIAVGQLIKLLSPWSSDDYIAVMIEYDGNRQIVSHSSKISILEKKGCSHFIEADIGDPFFAENH